MHSARADIKRLKKNKLIYFKGVQHADNIYHKAICRACCVLDCKIEKETCILSEIIKDIRENINEFDKFRTDEKCKKIKNEKNTSSKI